MTATHRFHKILLEKFDFEPTQGQNSLFVMLADFIGGQQSNTCLLVKGYAGTGKTTAMGALIKTLETFRIRYVLMTPTGRAAKVLSQQTQRSASTIHKKIYRQKSSNDGFGNFMLEKNLHKNTLFIVDEASMIGNESKESNIFGSGNLLEDLIAYVNAGEKCKLIILGDTAQLPPVGLTISPALETDFLSSYGLQIREVELKDVMRQSLESDVLMNATMLRELISSNNSGKFLCFKREKTNEVIPISGVDLIDSITEAYDKDGVENTIIITRSNKRANQYNQGIRQRILWHEEEINAGDLLMVVKNNYFWTSDIEEIDFIANGDIARIERIRKYYDRYGLRFADVTLTLMDYDEISIDTKIMLDTLSVDSPSLSYEQNRSFYQLVAEDYSHIKNRRKQYEAIRVDPFFNALQVKFAYAITCHKAQGGQWKNVFVDHGFINDEMINREFYRWLYTAVTRTTDKLFLVNFKEEFFTHQ